MNKNPGPTGLDRPVRMFAAGLVLAGLLAGGQPAAAQTVIPRASPSDCAPAAGLHFVCNLFNVEDFLPVAGGTLAGRRLLQTGFGGPISDRHPGKDRQTCVAVLG